MFNGSVAANEEVLTPMIRLLEFLAMLAAFLQSRLNRSQQFSLLLPICHN